MVIDVRHTWAQLVDLTITIARDAPVWRVRGITLSGWGPTTESNTVVIELRSPTAAAAQALYNAYGADWITVSAEPVAQEFLRPGSPGDGLTAHLPSVRGEDARQQLRVDVAAGKHRDRRVSLRQLLGMEEAGGHRDCSARLRDQPGVPGQ